MIDIQDYREELADDARYIFANLRADDKRMFAEYKDLEEALVFHVEKSCELKIVYIDEKPVCLFGITKRYPVLEWKYLVFHFGTDTIDRHKKSFVKIGRSILNDWLGRYGDLYMTVHGYYKKSFVMAKAFGFKFKFNIYDVYIFTRQKGSTGLGCDGRKTPNSAEEENTSGAKSGDEKGRCEDGSSNGRNARRNDVCSGQSAGVANESASPTSRISGAG